MEKVGVISDSYQPNADKPILYPIEIPKYTDVTVKLKWNFCVGGPTAPSKLRAKFSGKVKILEMILSALSNIVHRFKQAVQGIVCTLVEVNLIIVLFSHHPGGTVRMKKLQLLPKPTRNKYVITDITSWTLLNY